MFERPTGAEPSPHHPAPAPVPLHRGWLFRPGDSPAAKRVSLAGVALMLLAFYGASQKDFFLPSDLTLALAWPLGAVAGLCAAAALALERNTRAPVLEGRPLRRLLGTLMFAGLFTFVGWLASAYGISSLWTRATGEPGTLAGRVTELHEQSRGRACRFRVDAHVPDLDDIVDPCIGEPLWRSLRKGDALTIHTRWSRAGLLLQDYEVAPRGR